MKVSDGLRLMPAIARSSLREASPYKLLLSLTDRCTHRCLQCQVWARRPGDELRPDEVARLLEQLPSLRWLDLTGGEIVARPDADELGQAIVSQARGLALLHFATNGWSPDKVLRLAEHLRQAQGPRLVVTVSVDGDRELNDRLRGRDGAFDRAIETAAALDRLGDVDVYIGTTVTPDNLDALDRTHAALAQALPNLAAGNWHINLMNRSRHFFGNLEQPLADPLDLRRAVDVIAGLRGQPKDAFAVIERLFLLTLRGYLGDARAPVPCQALRASVFVGPTGDVYPCHIRDARLGNVRDTGLDLRRVLQGPAARADAEQLRLVGCDGCWTPCEAYPSMIASPVHTLAAAATAWARSLRA